MSEGTLAARQAALVAALVAGQPIPDGFDESRVAVTARALRNKRAGEVSQVWPRLASAFGPDWPARFDGWASGRAPRGALRDGWDLARELARLGQLPPGALAELAAREVTVRYHGRLPPRPRRWPAVRRTPAGLVVGFLGRVWLLSR